MRLYWELAQRSFQQTLTYRGATLAGLFTNSIFGFFIASVFLALFASGGVDGGEDVAGWSVDQTITLVWINQSLLMTIYIWGWWEVVRAIQSGAIVNELLKPIDYFSYWMARDIGRGIAHFTIRGLPTFAVGYIFFDLLLPASVLVGAAFLLSVAMAVLVCFCLRFIVNLAGFWVLDFRGINAVYIAIANVLSGLLAPLAFLPDPMQQAANLLPFRAFAMVPNEIYLGRVSPVDGLSLQLFWIVALSILARIVLHAGERKVVVQGG